MDIEQLKYVLVLAKYQSFSEAAYEISISQSSLSKHLLKIEKELGIKLFDRSTHPVRLTDAGEKFINHAKRIIEEYNALKDTMNRCSALSNVHLVVGNIPVMRRLGLSQLIVDFQKKYPSLNIEIRERQNKELIELLKRREIDAAIITCYPGLSLKKYPITLYPILEDDLVLVVNKLNPLAERSSIDLREAKDELFFLLDADTGIYKICAQAFRKAGFFPKIHERRNSETIMDLVYENLGVSLLTRRLAQSFQIPNIACVPLNKPFRRVISLAVLNQPHNVLPAKTFIRHCLDWVSQTRK